MAWNAWLKFCKLLESSKDGIAAFLVGLGVILLLLLGLASFPPFSASILISSLSARLLMAFGFGLLKLSRGKPAPTAIVFSMDPSV